jgi:molybdopterin molybdotransferase
VTRPFRDARAEIIAALQALAGREEVPLAEALGRVLAVDVHADRDQPPFHRSTRDGFAVRAAELPGPLRVVGEIAAGQALGRALAPGEAAEIMTGAPVPDGADAVLMVEHATRAGAELTASRTLKPGENIVAAGSELGAGATAVAAGRRIGTAETAMLATLGAARVAVTRRPRVAICATGEELVGLDSAPGPTQIRDSNTYTLAAQVRRAGGVPVMLAPARDEAASLSARLEEALAAADVILFSGGVSMGKYDLVEDVFARHGGRVVWDGVAIRPGKPAVFGLIGGKPFFGLPGNPLSTLVTFELFARAALDRLAGAEPVLRFQLAQLSAPLAQGRLPLAVFTPARLTGTYARPLRSQGSGDLAALCRADGFIVTEPEVTDLPEGAVVPFLPR